LSGQLCIGKTRHHAVWSAARVFLCSLALGVLLGGCAQNRFETRTPGWGDTLRGAADRAVETPPARGVELPAPEVPEATGTQREFFYKPGTDTLVREVRRVADAREQPSGSVKLNFQNANLLEVVKIVLGDMLQRNYVIDPAVQGAVSMQTTQALRRDDLIPTLEMMLRMNNAALITDGDVYRIVPLPDALAEARAPQLGDSSLALPTGFNVRVVPLRYVSAEEMAQILTPFVASGNQLLRVDTTRNMLVLASASGNMDRLLETIHTFDVDGMAGMSVALFTPDFVDAKTLAEELEELLANPDYGLMRGVVRFVVVERLNGLIVVTPRAEHLARVRDWVRRLDRTNGDATPRLFIYRVQNGKATELAEMLRDLFGSAQGQSPEAELAPGLKPKTVGQAVDEVLSTEEAVTLDAEDPISPEESAQGTPNGGVAIRQNEKIQIIADESNNALLILAKGTEYRQILAALRQLDVSVQQVLIEVTIAEVSLTDNLAFGVEWFFKTNFGSTVGEGQLDFGGGIAGLVPGFSYALKGPDVSFVLNTLAEESNLSVISSPSLLVLNNQEATINVGEEVPVATQERQSTVDPESPLINTIEYRDTGVLLKVKPRVNAGGLVIMEVEQEQSTAPSTSIDSLTPRIQQRKISSTVAVNSGDTIILGGLIQENRNLTESGIPGLHKIPMLGALFGTKSDNQKRTELIVLITPRAISSSTAALQVTEDYRRRLKKLIPGRKQPTPPADPVTDTKPAPRPTATVAPPAIPAGTPVDESASTTTATEGPLPGPTTIAGATPASAEAWGVQVGSFKNQQRAEALVTRLRKAGVAAQSPKAVQVGGDTWYRVNAGPTPDRQQAQALLPRIQEIAGSNGIIVRHQ
jgi:general secretion pathway protein D